MASINCLFHPLRSWREVFSLIWLNGEQGKVFRAYFSNTRNTENTSLWEEAYVWCASKNIISRVAKADFCVFFCCRRTETIFQCSVLTFLTSCHVFKYDYSPPYFSKVLFTNHFRAKIIPLWKDAAVKLLGKLNVPKSHLQKTCQLIISGHQTTTTVQVT